MSEPGLVVLHVDGLSREELLRAVAGGRLPTVRRLLEEEGYEAVPYRCGVPSTTPFAQAGILYGDNREIPGFRWWDRQAGTVIGFGPLGTFKQVAHRYFRGRRPLCEDGAAIAACYPAGAAETFGLSYRDMEYTAGQRSAGDVLRPWLANPAHLADLLGHGARAVAETAAADVSARLRGLRPARSYVTGDMLEEVLLHHQARYATVEAMNAGYPAIYAGFYAYDETGHALGPADDYTQRVLLHVDHTIAEVAAHRAANRSGREYRLVVLSDHGQVETVSMRDATGRSLGEVVAGRLPGCRVEEHNGRAFGPQQAPQTRVVLTFSGGLAHLYMAGFPERLDGRELRRRLPGLAEAVAAAPGVDLVLLREGRRNLALADGREFRFGGRDAGPAAELLARYDEPDVLARQLDRLNGFANSGDLIAVGHWDAERRRQVNFEQQAGGHGSIGGSQLHPFLLLKPEWGVEARALEGAHQVYDVLMRLRPWAA